MSDEAIYGEGDRDFHSPFDLNFDPVAVDTIKWLLAGHVLYLIGLAIVIALPVDNGNIWITPLFVAPLLWAGRKNHNWLWFAVLVVGMTAAHFLAVKFAIENYWRNSLMTPGLIGGGVGAGAALGLCTVFGLLRPGVPTLVFAAFGALLLAGVGGFGTYMYLSGSGMEGGGFTDAFVRMLWIYVPWQLVFAYVLAKTLKPVGD